jgi:hypothetical protein
MRLFLVLLVSLFCFSFRPSTEKAVNNSSNGFYIFVEDFTDRTNHKYIVQSRDSVDVIFNMFFESELELGNVDRPISIYNGKRDFYVARVSVFQKPNGELGFKHLKYSSPYVKSGRRFKLKPVTL